MIKHNQNGAVNVLLFPLIIAVVLLIAAISFGGWAFNQRSTYKNNADQLIAAAVSQAKSAEDKANAATYAEEAKSPLKAYNGPQEYGSLKLLYPKTWSGYVDDNSNNNSLLDGYFNPDIVPAVNNGSDGTDSTVFALHISVIDNSYSNTVSSLSNPDDQTLTVTSKAYALPKVPKVIGVMLMGTSIDGGDGTTVLFPLRDKTLEISTDGNQYLNDFNTYILPNLSFSP